MTQFELSSYGAQIVGDREYQQDRILVLKKDNSLLLAVCDGMGGMDAGDRASQLAVDELKDRFLHVNNFSAINKQEFMRECAYVINERICQIQGEDEQFLSSGTTIVMLMVVDGQLYWLSVGDSKIFIVRGDECVCPIKEHTYQQVLDQYHSEGILTTIEIQGEEERGAALTSYLGIGKLDLIEQNMQPFQLEVNDLLMLCSDGLYKAINEKKIQKYICESNGESVSHIVECLLREVQQSGKNTDNTSIIVSKVIGEQYYG